jgi:hypothetical protein
MKEARGTERRRETRSCHYCSIVGHIEVDCKRKKREQLEVAGVASVASRNDNTSEVADDSLAFFCLSGDGLSREKFIGDTGGLKSHGPLSPPLPCIYTLPLPKTNQPQAREQDVHARQQCWLSHAKVTHHRCPLTFQNVLHVPSSEGGLISLTTLSWALCKQPTVVLSSTEAEYMAVTQVTNEQFGFAAFSPQLGFLATDPLSSTATTRGQSLSLETTHTALVRSTLTSSTTSSTKKLHQEKSSWSISRHTT